MVGLRPLVARVRCFLSDDLYTSLVNKLVEFCISYEMAYFILFKGNHPYSLHISFKFIYLSKYIYTHTAYLTAYDTSPFQRGMCRKE